MKTNEAAEQSAVAAAEKWLALLNTTDYAECWDQTSSVFRSGIQTSSLFKSGVSRQQWQSSVGALQTQLGKAVARSLTAKRYAQESPGEPEGEYVVLEYETSFEGRRDGVETVTLMKDQDGEWRVSGYHFVLGHIRQSI
jgi:hypothetical protein